MIEREHPLLLKLKTLILHTAPLNDTFTYIHFSLWAPGEYILTVKGNSNQANKNPPDFFFLHVLYSVSHT